MPKRGNVALLSQSGAMIDSILDRATEENFGFSKIISYGNELNLGLNDFLEFLRKDN